MKTLHRNCLAILLAAMSAHAVADRLADPTRPARAPRAQTADSRQAVRVEAILHSADRTLAIVNGKVVRAGDHVSGVRVEEILADGIRFVRDGQVHTARLRPAAMSVRRDTQQERSR